MAKRKVQIVELPKAQTGQQVGYSLYNRLATMGGLSDSRPRNDLSVSKTIGAVPREEANLEAEGGETVMIPELYGNVPTHFTISGPRHAQGGVPMNLPENSFIFSDYVNMKIKDPDVLNYFGKTAKKGGKVKGYTPADIAKQYDINKYIKVLQDPNSDDIDKKTAEMMIKNYNLKLGALGLVQEAQKGFETGIPEVSEPFMDHVGVSPADLGVVSDEAKELVPVIQQMMEQGIELDEIIVELITNEVAPDVMMEALTVIGMSEEEAGQLIEGVMAELMSSQQQPQPMSQESPNPQMPLDPIDPQQTQEIMNMSEEPMSPEMMLCGGKAPRKLKKQMGGPGTEMMGQEQMMQPGMEQMGQPNPEQEVMQQVMVAVEQMMQEGLELNQIVFELLNMQVPEQIIAEVLMQAGVSEPELQEAFEIAMSHPEMGGGQDIMMDPNMQGMSPEMMPEMNPGMAMMQMGGTPQMGMGQEPSLEEMIAQALQQGAAPEQIIEILIQQGLDPQRAQESVTLVAQQMQGMQQPQYGMQPQMKKGGSIKKYQSGGTVPAKYIDKPEYTAGSEKFNLRNLKKGDWIKTAQGYQELYVDPSVLLQNYDEDVDVNALGRLLQISYLESLKNNDTFIEAFSRAYDDAVSNDDFYLKKDKKHSGMLSKKQKFLNLTPEEKTKRYLTHIIGNAKLDLKGFDPNDFKQNGQLDESKVDDAQKEIYQELAGKGEPITIENIKLNHEDEIGYKVTDKNWIASAQAGQWAYNNLLTQPNEYYKDLDPDQATELQKLLQEKPQFGVSDETGTGLGYKNISPIDGIDTNTTSGHAAAVMIKGEPVVLTPDKVDEEQKKINDEMMADDQPMYKPPSYVDLDWHPGHHAQYYDAISRRHLPNLTLGMPDITPQFPGYHLQDWRQEAYDAQQYANQNAQLIASMPTNAGVTRANLLGLQGKTAENQGRAQARVKAINQQVKNQFEPMITDIANRTNIARGTAWDRMLQQMNMRDQEQWIARKKSDTDAINVGIAATEDQAKRAALMMMNPQVAIDPRGFTYMHNPLDIVPEQSSDGSDVANIYNTFFQKTGDKALAKDLTELHFGKGYHAKDRQVRPGDSNRQAMQDYMQVMQSQKGGAIGVYGADVFPFMFY